MLILHESAAGFALFKVDEKKIKKAETEVCYWRSNLDSARTSMHACIISQLVTSVFRIYGLISTPWRLHRR